MKMAMILCWAYFLIAGVGSCWTSFRGHLLSAMLCASISVLGSCVAGRVLSRCAACRVSESKGRERAVAHHLWVARMATGYVLERLSELREEAYCKVLRCFLASQQYDLVGAHAPHSWPSPPKLASMCRHTHAGLKRPCDAMPQRDCKSLSTCLQQV